MPLNDAVNYANPYEKDSLAAIALDRAMGEAMGVIAAKLAEICLPLPPPLEERLRSVNEIFDAMKAKASQEKRERDLPEKLSDPADVVFEHIQAAVSEAVLKK